MILTLETYMEQDYDLNWLIWVCPYCKVRAAEEIWEVKKDSVIVCPLCKMAMKILNHQIKGSKSFKLLFETLVEVHNTPTQIEVLFDIDLIQLAFEKLIKAFLDEVQINSKSVFERSQGNFDIEEFIQKSKDLTKSLKSLQSEQQDLSTYLCHRNPI